MSDPGSTYDPTDDITAAWRLISSDPANATAAFELVVARCGERLGGDHPDTRAATLDLACWRDGGGHVKGAAVAAQRLLDDLIRILGPDHLESLAGQNNVISSVCLARGRRVRV